MASVPMSSVAVAIDARISFGRFASAIGQAGLRLEMRDGVLSVLDAPMPAVRVTKRRAKGANSRRRSTAKSPTRSKLTSPVAAT